MSSDINLDEITRSAAMIVAGYAFLRMDNGYIRIVNIHPPYHAAVIRTNGEMLETSMDDIEFSRLGGCFSSAASAFIRRTK